jgi:hypothetical protein
MFGIQLLDEGKVVDYRQANAYQREIEAMGELTVQGCATVVDRFKVTALPPSVMPAAHSMC